MNALGVGLVVAGVVIATGSLASLAVIVLVAVVPWSHFRPRYQRSVRPSEQHPVLPAMLGRAIAGLGVRRGLPARGAERPISRHPRGARHLHPLVHGR